METETKIFIVALSLFAWFLLSTIGDTGVTHDEVVYFKQTLALANSSLGFFEKFEVFKPPFHGAFVELFSLPFYVLTKNILDTTTALRVGISIMYLAFLVIVFFFVKKETNRFIALATVLVMIGMPKLFFHSHLLAHDFPIAILYMIITMLFYKALTTKKWLFILLTGAVLGALLATKITGYIIFVALLVYTIIHDLYTKKITIVKYKNIKIPLILVIFTISAIAFFLISPHFYKNPFAIVEYLTYHSPTSRWDKVFLFNAVHDPLSLMAFLFVPFTLITTFNAIHVFFALCGFLVSFTDQKRRTLMIYIGSIFVFTTLFYMSPLGYKGDGHGERYFLMLYPFLALYAGIGIQALTNTLIESAEQRKLRIKKSIPLLIIVLLSATSAFTIVATHPFQSSYFNAIVGGTENVAKHSILTVTYWSDELKYTLDLINSLPENTTISAPPQESPYRWYQEQGMLKKSIRISHEQGDYLVITLRQSSIFPYPLWEAATRGTITPIFVVKNNQGVDLVRIFRVPQLELQPSIAWPFKEYEAYWKFPSTTAKVSELP